MIIHQETFKEFGHVLIHLGEAAIIGGAAALFVQGLPLAVSLTAFIGGILLVFSGLYFINRSHLKEKLKEQ
ncbi:MAG: hypothetical protein ONB44_06475 [candidate division KSB1 bacterium]|nr:hypothetical protein [candidate division KSB1 bacterium]MDZ7301768.1 hypothetical protein [candidate division KSB1 bacterium]MDZ7311453.1 hypothetical protein [candidate division KSB1 bacterium]